MSGTKTLSVTAITGSFKPGNFKHKYPGTHVTRNKYFIDIKREFQVTE